MAGSAFVPIHRRSGICALVRGRRILEFVARETVCKRVVVVPALFVAQSDRQIHRLDAILATHRLESLVHDDRLDIRDDDAARLLESHDLLDRALCNLRTLRDAGRFDLAGRYGRKAGMFELVHAGGEETRGLHHVVEIIS